MSSPHLMEERWANSLRYTGMSLLAFGGLTGLATCLLPGSVSAQETILRQAVAAVLLVDLYWIYQSHSDPRSLGDRGFSVGKRVLSSPLGAEPTGCRVNESMFLPPQIGTGSAPQGSGENSLVQESCGRLIRNTRDSTKRSKGQAQEESPACEKYSVSFRFYSERSVFQAIRWFF